MAEISKIQWLDFFNENPACAKTMLKYAREELYSHYAYKEEIENNDELKDCFEIVKRRFSLEDLDMYNVFFEEIEDSHEEQQNSDEQQNFDNKRQSSNEEQQNQKEEKFDLREEIFEALHRFQICKLHIPDPIYDWRPDSGFVEFLGKQNESEKLYDEFINKKKKDPKVKSLENGRDSNKNYIDKIWDIFKHGKEEFCKNRDVSTLKDKVDAQIEDNLDEDYSDFREKHRDSYNTIFDTFFWNGLKNVKLFYDYCSFIGYDVNTTISKVFSDLADSWFIDQEDDFLEGLRIIEYNHPYNISRNIPLGQPDSEIEPYVKSLRKDKNVILQGAPGVGKTYTAQLIMDFFKSGDDSRVKFVTFHQSMGYEDFVEGIKAKTTNGAIEYSTEDGVFKEFCREAWKRPDEEFLMVIDEINRGNISRIFGELISLIEKDKRSGGSSPLSATLPYTKDEFTVPSNIYILGTMNTTDRSVGGIDYALRRRFTFRTIKAEKNKLNTWPQESNKLFEDVENIINNHKAQDISNVDDIMVGHSYFMTNDILDAWKNKIRPLLEEYINDGILKNSARGEIEELNKLLDPRETNTNE